MTYLCEYGSCHEDGNLPILVTDKSTDPHARPRFCSYAHAIGWLMGRIDLRHDASESALLAIQGIFRIAPAATAHPQVETGATDEAKQ